MSNLTREEHQIATKMSKAMRASNADPFAVKRGKELASKALEEHKKRKESSDKEIQGVAKEAARYFVRVPVSFGPTPLYAKNYDNINWRK